MAALDDVQAELGPILDELGLELYDLEHAEGTLRITVDVPGEDALGTELLARATRAISAMLDEADPFPGRYTLEVSSPGLERALRRPEHFAGAVGSEVSLKTRPGTGGDRRVAGTLVSADGGRIVVAQPDGEDRTLAVDDIERARTVVDWSRPPKPGKAGKPGTTGRTEPTDDTRKAPTS